MGGLLGAKLAWALEFRHKEEILPTLRHGRHIPPYVTALLMTLVAIPIVIAPLNNLGLIAGTLEFFLHPDATVEDRLQAVQIAARSRSAAEQFLLKHRFDEHRRLQEEVEVAERFSCSYISSPCLLATAGQRSNTSSRVSCGLGPTLRSF